MNDNEMRKLALELAVSSYGGEKVLSSNIISRANKFYEWLTQDGEASEAQTVDPETPYGSKDVVSKEKLKESVQHLREYYRNRQKVVMAAHLAGYDEAIKDVLRVIDLL